MRSVNYEARGLPRLFARIVRIVDNNGNAVVSAAWRRRDRDAFAKLGKHYAIHVAYASYFLCTPLTRAQRRES